MKTIKSLFAYILISLFCIPAFAQSGTFRLSTHILDINKGLPVPHVDIKLYKFNPDSQKWIQVAENKTDQNGRVADFLPSNQENRGIYKLKFETEPYFQAQHLNSIYPYIEIVFKIEDKGHYHIPITMSANGYSTYKGN